MSTEQTETRPRSHLFTVRVWEEDINPNQAEWRGKVQLLTTGEVRYFREWTRLVPVLVALLAELDSEIEANH